MEEQWVIRKANPSDISFIYSTWLKSYRHNSAVGKSGIRKSVYFENYREVVDHLLQKSTVFVACLPDELDVVLGYLVFEERVIHYCFVKEAFRLLEIATDLIRFADFPQNKETYYTHVTNNLSRVISQKFPNFTYNPFIIYKRD